MISGGPTVVAIGNFDGVHRGHREVLAAARATRPGLPVVAVTFWPLPMVVLRPDAAPELLCDLPERIELLRAAGADEVRVVEFTRRVAEWSPEEFVERVLLPLHPSAVVVGENFRFGHKAAGTVDTLRELGAGTFEVAALPLVSDDSAYSSSRIRRALDDGDVAVATEILGRPFRYTGIVVMGDQRGRTLGFPTANLRFGGKTPALRGIYATLVHGIGAAPMPSVSSFGTRPTVDGVEPLLEAHLFDFDGDLYGRRIEVEFVAKLRDEEKFADLAALKVQMDRDAAAARRILDDTPTVSGAIA